MIVDQHRDERPTSAELAARALIARQDLVGEHADVLGVVLNKVPRGEHAVITSQVGRQLADAGLPFAGGMPFDPILGECQLRAITQTRATRACVHAVMPWASACARQKRARGAAGPSPHAVSLFQGVSAGACWLVQAPPASTRWPPP